MQHTCMPLTEHMPCFGLKILKLFFSYVFNIHVCYISVHNSADKEQIGSYKEVYIWYKTYVELIRISPVFSNMTLSTVANSNVSKEHISLTFKIFPLNVDLYIPVYTVVHPIILNLNQYWKILISNREQTEFIGTGLSHWHVHANLVIKDEFS